MTNKKILIYIYKKISKFYVLLFGRKKMQFLNDFILALSLDAKGYKNYGNFEKTGEKSFIRLIKNEINFSIDVGANVGNYTKLLLSETSSKVVSFEPLPEAFKSDIALAVISHPPTVPPASAVIVPCMITLPSGLK